jgi:GNAT superfamily N-acetyltransferase
MMTMPGSRWTARRQENRVDAMADRMHTALWAAFNVFVPLIADGRIEDRDGYRVVSVPSFPIPIANAVWADAPDERSAIRGLAASLEEIQTRGVNSAVVVLDGLTPGVEAEARRLGLTGVERLPGMVATPSTFRSPEGSAPEFVLVGDDPTLLEVALDVTVRGFEAPRELMESLFASAMSAEPVELWLAYAGGDPVSTATGIATGDAVGIFSVGTPPEHRRKGYGAWATARAVGSAFEAGASFAYLQSSEMGFGVYERLGFEQVCEYLLLSGPDTPSMV